MRYIYVQHVQHTLWIRPEGESLNIFIRLQRMLTYWIFFHTSAFVGAIRRSVTGPLAEIGQSLQLKETVDWVWSMIT